MNSQPSIYVEVIEEMTIIEEKPSYKGLTGHWSKWGGRRDNVYVNQYGVIIDDWVCQSCGKQQTKDLTPYRFEFYPDEYIRVCAICLYDGCEKLKKRVHASYHL